MFKQLSLVYQNINTKSHTNLRRLLHAIPLYRAYYISRIIKKSTIETGHKISRLYNPLSVSHI